MAQPCEIPGVVLIRHQVREDARGSFAKLLHPDDLGWGSGQAFPVRESFISWSEPGVLRGMHYQLANPQGKLVRVVSGRVFDVAVDMRRDSPRLGQWAGVELSADNHRMLWIPPGFAHGFLVMSESADFLYKATAYYAPQDERTLAWDDPQVAIDWPLEAGCAPQVSAKDQAGARLADAPLY